MAKITFNPLQLEIKIDTAIVEQYGLDNFITNPFKLSNPIITYRPKYLKKGKKICVPFTFPPFFTKHSKKYLEEFLSLYNVLARDINQSHSDNILFLANCYFNKGEKNLHGTLIDDIFRNRGKLLLDLIKVPIPILNQDNIYEAFADELHLDDEDIRQQILAYLNVATGKRESQFLSDHENPLSDINFESIDDGLWNELTRLIQRDRNISILIHESKPDINGDTEKKYLTISKDLDLKFQPKRRLISSKALVPLDQHQNSDILENTLILN